MYRCVSLVFLWRSDALPHGVARFNMPSSMCCGKINLAALEAAQLERYRDVSRRADERGAAAAARRLRPALDDEPGRVVGRQRAGDGPVLRPGELRPTAAAQAVRRGRAGLRRAPARVLRLRGPLLLALPRDAPADGAELLLEVPAGDGAVDEGALLPRAQERRRGPGPLLHLAQRERRPLQLRALLRRRGVRHGPVRGRRRRAPGVPGASREFSKTTHL